MNATGGSPAQQDVAVRLLVSNSPLLNVPGATLAFNYQLGAAIPAPQDSDAHVYSSSTQLDHGSDGAQHFG